MLFDTRCSKGAAPKRHLAFALLRDIIDTEDTSGVGSSLASTTIGESHFADLVRDRVVVFVDELQFDPVKLFVICVRIGIGSAIGFF